MAGQRFMVGFDGLSLSTDLKYLIDTLKVGGIILFKRNVSSPEQIADLCASAQAHAAACGQPPLLIAIDQEGGQVARLGPPFSQFPGNPYMKNVRDADSFAEITAREIGEVGINMNMAPVLDVPPEQLESVMAGRAFGSDPEWISVMGKHVIKGLQQNGVMAVAKHFPGIGRTTLDSHLDLPTLETDKKTMAAMDLKPFHTAVACGVAGVMLSHIRYSAIDPQWPASLSAKIAGAWLRDELGYNGVVMTDDLDMGAVSKHYDVRTMVRQVAAADVDLALICHRSARMEEAFEEMLRIGSESLEMAERAHRSLERIMSLKKKYLEPISKRPISADLHVGRKFQSSE
jgi:beta-N-acetylhexosaminidase